MRHRNRVMTHRAYRKYLHLIHPRHLTNTIPDRISIEMPRMTPYRIISYEEVKESMFASKLVNDFNLSFIPSKLSWTCDSTVSVAVIWAPMLALLRWGDTVVAAVDMSVKLVLRVLK